MLPPAKYAPRNAPWDEYFASVQTLMNENPPPVTDTALLRKIEGIVRLGATFDASRFSDDDIAAIQTGISDARKIGLEFRRNLHRVTWLDHLVERVGSLWQSYAQRAVTAIGGLAALPRSEAMYFSARGPDGLTGFDSSDNWKLTFTAAELPPVDAFWSLSLYRMTAEGQLYFVDNTINRYAIGDRTPAPKARQRWFTLDMDDAI